MDGRPLSPGHYTAEEVARLLQLEPLELEGGYFRRTAESALILPGGKRAWSTIYSLITPEGFSALLGGRVIGRSVDMRVIEMVLPPAAPSP